MKALCYILILTLLSLIAVSEVNGEACDVRDLKHFGFI